MSSAKGQVKEWQVDEDDLYPLGTHLHFIPLQRGACDRVQGNIYDKTEIDEDHCVNEVVKLSLIRSYI